MPYPLMCYMDIPIPCIRGGSYEMATVWMLLVPTSLSLSFILVCLGIVAFTVLQQRKIAIIIK
jgi:hypothetical protein